MHEPTRSAPATAPTVRRPPRRPSLRQRLWRQRWLRYCVAALFFRVIPHGRLLGLRVAGAGTDTIEAVLPYRPELIGNPWSDAVHGGAVTTMIDQTSGAAASLSSAPPSVVATLDLRVDYLRPARPGAALRAVAQAYRVTERIVFVRCLVHDGDPAQPLAIGMSTFMRNGPLPNPFARLLRPGRKRRP